MDAEVFTEQIEDILKDDDTIEMIVIGLGGEAGEVLDAWKKIMRNGMSKKRRRELMAEMGDVVTFITALALRLDSSLSEIIEKASMKVDERGRI